MKLRKLRALRGGAAVNGQQQPQQPQGGLNGNKNSVLSDLESIRSVFNEKEKELSMAVRKVEELTHQVNIVCRPREIGLTWLLGQVCTNSAFYIFVLFTSHFLKQPNLAGTSLYALIIRVSCDLRFDYYVKQ
jgi:hypothetical protein